MHCHQDAKLGTLTPPGLAYVLQLLVLLAIAPAAAADKTIFDDDWVPPKQLMSKV